MILTNQHTMKGVILHGGSGTRLRPLTYTDVKQLLPLAGKPVSEYALLNLVEIGITEINIIVGEVGSSEVEKYYGDGSKWGVNITYTNQGKPLGIAHAIGLTKEFIGDSKFVVILGDNYFQGGLKALSETFLSRGQEALIALTKVRTPSQFGIAQVENGKIISLVEKPKAPISDLAIAGAYFLSPSIFPIIDSLTPSWRNELEITEAFQIMLAKGVSIGYSIITGWWKDTGTVEEFLQCNRMVLDRVNNSRYSSPESLNIHGRVEMGDNVKVLGISKIMGPAYIGSDTVIEDSYIGPYTSIGSNCIIKDSEIEDSVVMDGCKISLSKRKRIRESMLGPNVMIDALENDLNPVRLIVGRDSKLTL